MSIYSIRLYLEPNPDGQFTVTSPDVPGLVTEGDTPEVIQANVQEALEALLDEDYFRQVSIDSAGGIVWPNGYDFCPNYLYEDVPAVESVAS